jgi:hypothetical protein
MARSLLILLSISCAAWTQTSDEARLIFSRQVAPLFREKCQGCHGVAQKISNFSTSSRDDLLRGGTRGPSIVPGNPSTSLLLRAIEQSGALKMPPGQKLPGQTIAAVRRWIELGAPWTESDAGPTVTGGRLADDVWAFQPLSKIAVPSGTRLPIDWFITQRLEKAKIKPAPPADRRILIRRAIFDLWGLPPSPEDVDAFVRDPLPDAEAWRNLVERLLASPHYGERWGRHWLDVVRYADTSGFSNDFERPHAWRYRDYVIRAFNTDKPFNQFIVEQIAGDELDAQDPEKLIATGFLRMGPWEHTAMSVAAVTRQEWLDDVTHTAITSFLGITMECARCHDHKFDMIPTKEYYRVQAAFAATGFADRPAPFLPGEVREDFEAGRARLQEMLRGNQAKLDEFDELVRQRLAEQKGVKSWKDLPVEEVTQAVRTKQLLTGEEFERLKVYQKRRELHDRSSKRYEARAYSVSNGPFQPGERAKWSPPDTFILPVGNLQTPGEKVTPGVIAAVYRPGTPPSADLPQAVEGRRLGLANWIATARNPLTSRVMVNRIWHYHFGRGIVETPNDFGKLGKRPSHPDLLDWLAAYFIDHGWSVKAMHRLIMLSDAYQRSARHPDMDSIAKVDPENRLLSFFPARRLEAEEIRDGILAVSGELSLDTGGPGTFPEINEDVAVQPQQIMGTLMPAYTPSPTKRERNRRTVYTFQKRNLVNPMIEVFNGASLNESTARRDTTTIPTQAFTLFNSRFVQDAALSLAARLDKMGGGQRVKVDNAFRLALNRTPNDEERGSVLAHLEKRIAYHQKTPAWVRPERKTLVRAITSELTGSEVTIEEQPDSVQYEENIQPSSVSPQTRALADIALVLFNSNEFLYVY